MMNVSSSHAKAIIGPFTAEEMRRRGHSDLPAHIAPYDTGSMIDSPSYQLQFTNKRVTGSMSKEEKQELLADLQQYMDKLAERYRSTDGLEAHAEREEARQANRSVDFKYEMQELQQYLSALQELRQQELDPNMQQALDEAIGQMRFQYQQMAREMEQQQAMHLPNAA